MNIHGKPFSGVLFDLDGTLIDSLPAVERVWARWADRNGLPREEVLPRIHGRRSIDSLRALAPHLDCEAEDDRLQREETEDTEGVRLIPGASELVQLVVGLPWGIVTSGTRSVAQARLRAVGLPIPPVAVYGEDVPIGKPHPAPFKLGCLRLGLEPERVLAFEDTWAGIQSALGAGCFTIWRTESEVPAGLEDRIVATPDYRCLEFNRDSSRNQLYLRGQEHQGP